jgi:hypothetical protein
MGFLPQLHQIVEVRICYVKHVPYMISLCIARPDGVPPFSNAHMSIFAQFEDDNNPLVPAMNVRRIVIFRVHTESNSIESVRAHAARILSIGKGRANFLHRGQRLIEIRDQVVFVFDAAESRTSPCVMPTIRALLRSARRALWWPSETRATRRRRATLRRGTA